MLTPVIVRMVIACLLTTALIGPAAAANKCEVKTTTCIDARTGQARVCSTTICTDEKGDIISINTIVLKETGGSEGAKPPKGKVELKDLNVTKQLDKSSPK